jgi:hypothetical protein
MLSSKKGVAGRAWATFAGIGVLIEFWKITKVMDFTLVTRPGALPRLRIQDRGSYVKSKTKVYDDEALKYMSYALFPCVIGYFIYSLVYEKHKGWYVNIRVTCLRTILT